jgi:ACS family hexuronate transporter-like MFS transporter
MMLAALISYIDRNTLALLAPTILRETGLSAQEYGLIVSAFSIAYVLGNLIWGQVLDRAGVFWGMALAVALWSAASASHALASGLLGLAAARCLLGFAEGATFPGAVRTVMQTLAASRRSRGLALAYSGATVGALATPLLVTPIAACWGWRGAFWATGLVGVLWLLAWLPQSRRPDLSVPPRPQPGTDRAGTAVRWTNPRLWSFLAIYATGALPLAFVLYAAPLFLGQRLGLSQAELGRVLWLPPLGGEVGLFFWGWVTDRLTAHGGSLPALRRLFALLALLSLPLAFTAGLGSLGLVLGALSFAMFISGGFIIAALAYGTNVFPTARSGLVAGLASGSWSLLVAVAMPFFGGMFDQSRYTTAFAVAAGAPLAGFLAWWVLNKGAAIAARGSDRVGDRPQ